MIIHDEFGKAITIPFPGHKKDEVIYWTCLIYWDISKVSSSLFSNYTLDQVEGLAMRWTYKHKFQ